MAILRAILGGLIGVGYGLLIGAVTFQLLQPTYDPRYPGPMIPDANGWARLITFFAAVITGLFGVLVGVMIGLARANSTRRALIGACFGLGLFVLLIIWDFADHWSWLMRDSSHVWPILLSHLAMFLVAFPLGLPLVGLATGFITTRLKL